MEVTFLQSSATLLVRLLVGILFLFQGYDKIFRIGINNVADAANTPFIEKFFGRFVFRTSIQISSWLELLAGAILVAGFHRDEALILLSANMLVAGLVFTLIKPMWDMQYFFPRLILLVFLMIIPGSWDTFRIDSLFGGN
ncbi:MAG: hypothetical protein JJE25_07990 [Bacteroidia bacterium]|nr:hypothetical protein [Bacteroidia bacterium]